MRKVTMVILSFALFGFLVFEAYGQRGPRIVNDFGERSVERADFQGRRSSGRTARESASCHAYLTLQRVPTKAIMERIEQAGNIKILSLANIQSEDGQKKFTYLVRCNTGIARSLDLLAENGLDHIVYGISPMENNDKVTRGIFENHGFDKRVKADENRIYAIIRFYPDFNRNSADSLIRIYCDTIIETSRNGLAFTVVAIPPKLLILSRYEGVRSVREHIRYNDPTVYEGRASIGVDDVQQFNLTNMPSLPTVDQYWLSWLSDIPLTGEGISVGVYDTGIDSMRLDFREMQGDNTVLRIKDATINWQMDSDGHGTHVASIVGGSGCNTVENYKHRGVAPRVKFFSRGNGGGQHPLDDNRVGNISNHSHVHLNINSQFWYGDIHAEVDQDIFKNPSKIVVTASANSGVHHRNGSREVGYYSILASGKNYITVGATYSSTTHEGYPLKAELSSMGPTFDGRIKPDVMAPGDFRLGLFRDRYDTLITWIDSISIIGEGGNLRVGWGFGSGTMGWGSDRWDPLYKVGNITTENGALRYDTYGAGAYIWSDTLSKITANSINPICGPNDTLFMRYMVSFPHQEYAVDSLEMKLYWRNRNNIPHKGPNRFRIPVSGPSFKEIKICLGDMIGSWRNEYLHGDSLTAIRFDMDGTGTGGILAASLDTNAERYLRSAGTSYAAPFVSGVIALMLEKYKRNYLDPTGLSVDTYAFWNSTAKALLIHTATDMIKETQYPFESPNPDTGEPLVYYKGPDYATGWGLINAVKAVNHVDTNLFKQDTIGSEEVIIYKFNKSEWGNTRITLAWDDAGIIDNIGHHIGNAIHSKLVNDLDLHVIDPTGRKHFPWVLDPLPLSSEIFQSISAFDNYRGIDPIRTSDIKPARKGIDSLNNVEVVDIENAPPGEYIIVITGKQVVSVPPSQHFSLVADVPVTKIDSIPPSLLWRHKLREAQSGDTINVPSGEYKLYGSHSVPIAVSGVTLVLQPGTKLHLAEGAEIWVGRSGEIVGTDGITVSPQIIQYNTPYPRDPKFGEDKVVGLFGDLCTALRRGGSGRTTKLGPGIYNNIPHVTDQGLIGVRGRTRELSSVVRMGFHDSGPVCGVRIPPPSQESVSLIKDMHIEINGDVHTRNNPAFLIFGYGSTVFDRCIFISHNPLTGAKPVPDIGSGDAVQLGSEQRPLHGSVSFKNCNFAGFGTAVRVNVSSSFNETVNFDGTVFWNNHMDVRYNERSRVICGINKALLSGMLAIDRQLYTGDGIDRVITDICTKKPGFFARLFTAFINFFTGGASRTAYVQESFVDPLNSDFRPTIFSPLMGAGENFEDIGAYSMEQVFTFSRFLDGRVDFGNGQTVHFENGLLTANTLGNAVEFRAANTLNLRSVNELRISGNLVRKASDVTAWVRPGASVQPLPDEYIVWDAAMNGAGMAKLYCVDLPASGPVTKRVVPDTIPPAPVSGVNIFEESGDVVIKWNRDVEPDVARYKIFRAPVEAPHLTTQIASLPAHVIEYRDRGGNINDNVYAIVAYDSTGNMSPPVSGSNHISGNKLYSFSGFDAAQRDTLRVTPEGITVIVQNPDFQHGAMFTVRNRGHNDSLVVEWYGVRDQNHTDCESRSVNLFGNGAQINNIASPKMGNGLMMFNLRSAVKESYLVDVEIFNWRNGRGCQ